MQQGMHRRMLSLCRTYRRHWVDMARGSFKFKVDKYKHMKPIHCIALMHLPDSFESLRTYRRLVEKLP